MRTALAFAIVLCAAPARADDAAAEATRLFEEGRALYAQNLFPEACAKFARSYELDHKPGTQLNLGDCLERDGKLRRAYLMFEDAAREYDRIRHEAELRLAADQNAVDARRDVQVAISGAKLARERAQAIVPRLATVIVRLAEPRIDGLAVRIGDRAQPPAAEIVERYDGGTIAIVVSAPGREPFSTTAQVDPGKQVTILVPALRALVPASASIADDTGRRDRRRVVIALGLGAGGLVSLGAAGVLGLVANHQYDDAVARECARDPGGALVCSPAGGSAIDAAGTKADVATALGIAGVALAASAAIVYVTAPRERVRVTPVASTSSVGFAISARF
ncbi:MAG TPA: hypothetical protein VFQ53_31235 [Kofleriaceae bacterium]|nr:hypothetical protein [Kofleriaceae bacterium]